MAVFATLVAPPTNDGRKPAPTTAPVMPKVVSQDVPEV